MSSTNILKTGEAPGLASAEPKGSAVAEQFRSETLGVHLPKGGAETGWRRYFSECARDRGHDRKSSTNGLRHAAKGDGGFYLVSSQFLQNLPNPGGTKADRKSLHSAMVVNFVSSDHALPEGRDRTGWDLWFP